MRKIYVLLAVIIMLNGCGLTREDLGMAASTPDETQVTARKKLVLPPDFDVKPSM